MGDEDLKFTTSDRRAQRDVGFPIGSTTNPNKPNRFKFWGINQIDGFRPRQTQAIYLPCCHSDTAKFGPVPRKKWMTMTDQGSGERSTRYDEG